MRHERSLRTAAVVGAAAAALLGGAGRASADTVFGLTDQNALISFDSATPGTLNGAAVPIGGLVGGDALLGIDFRPATGELFGLGSGGRLYTIDTASGMAAQVGTETFAVPLTGTSFGFDFNPTVDRIRITSNAGQNLRVNPNNGAVVDSDPMTPGVQPDGNLAYAAGDVNFGEIPGVVASAYTNNFVGGPGTTLFNLDLANHTLVNQAPPNNGTLNTVGEVNFTLTGATGFDIASTNDQLFYSTQTALPALTGFYTLDRTSGHATVVGVIGGGVAVNDIAIVIPAPGGVALLGLGTLSARRRRRQG